MKGIRVSGTLDPGGKLAWPSQFKRLDGILAPLLPQLDRCWWYLDHGGVQPEADPSDTAKYEQVTRELASYVDEAAHDFLLARPGFFSRFGGSLSGDWHIYVAGDSPEPPIPAFSQIACSRRRQGENERAWWDELARPPDLSGHLCLLARGIDWAYWEIFFRDDEMSDQVWQHLSGEPLLHVHAV